MGADMLAQIEPVRVMVVEADQSRRGHLDGYFGPAIRNGHLKVGFAHGTHEGLRRLVGDRYQVVVVEVDREARNLHVVEQLRRKREDLSVVALCAGPVDQHLRDQLTTAGATAALGRTDAQHLQSVIQNAAPRTEEDIPAAMAR